MFKLQGIKEWYARFRGRKFYSKVREIYTRSNEIKPSIETKKRFLKSIGDK